MVTVVENLRKDIDALGHQVKALIDRAASEILNEDSDEALDCLRHLTAAKQRVEMASWSLAGEPDPRLGPVEPKHTPAPPREKKPKPLLTPNQVEALRAAARGELFAWVDSAEDGIRKLARKKVVETLAAREFIRGHEITDTGLRALEMTVRP